MAVLLKFSLTVPFLQHNLMKYIKMLTDDIFSIEEIDFIYAECDIYMLNSLDQIIFGSNIHTKKMHNYSGGLPWSSFVRIPAPSSVKVSILNRICWNQKCHFKIDWPEDIFL